jgi:predicted DNA binding CopG/RHH family protein
MKRKKHRKRRGEIHDYDTKDTTAMIDRRKPLRFADLGLELPETPATQVISIRLPSALLNEIRAFASQRDIPYQAAIKLFLAESLERRKTRAA